MFWYNNIAVIWLVCVSKIHSSNVSWHIHVHVHCNLLPLKAGFGEFDSWLSECVEKAAEALRVDGDPAEITRQLEEQQVHTYSFLLFYNILHKPWRMYMYMYVHTTYISYIHVPADVQKFFCGIYLKPEISQMNFS